MYLRCAGKQLGLSFTKTKKTERFIVNKIELIESIKLNQRVYEKSGNRLTVVEGEHDYSANPDIHAMLNVYTGGSADDRAHEISLVLEGYQVNRANKEIDLPIVTIIHRDGYLAETMDRLREEQVESRKHLVVKKVLANTKDSAINPLDIKIGFNQPISVERGYIKNFLLTLLTPAEAEKPYEGMDGFVDSLITKVFELTQCDKPVIPKMFDPNCNRELQRLAYCHISDEEHETGVTFQTVANRLHIEGTIAGAGSQMRELFWRARDIAHTFAMPVLADLITTMDVAGFDDIYTNTVETEETMTQYARRCISNAIKDFPCFANPTTFNIKANRVVSIDLQDVDAERDHRKNSLFLQAARMVAMNKVNYCYSDLINSDMNSIYNDYYKELAVELEKHKKALVIEGIDYYKHDSRLMTILEIDARERRKLGVDIIISTDNIAYYYDNTKAHTALNDANRVYIFSELKGDNLAAFKDMFTDDDLVMSDMAGLSDLGFMSYARVYRTPLIITRYHLNRLAWLHCYNSHEIKERTEKKVYPHC